VPSDKFTQNTISNETQNINSQCKIVVYNWKSNALTINRGVDSVLTQTDRLDISSQLLSCTFNKTLGNPSGTFSFTLSNSPDYGSGDWKDIIKRGSWCVIYMSQDGDLAITDKVSEPLKSAQKKEEAKKIRCIGFIDRVAVKSSINDKGAFDVTYEVSGRDFGVVYEDTTIWHNMFKYERIVLDALATSRLNITGEVSIDGAMNLIHDLFFNPKAVPGTRVNDNDSLTEIALQWLMPKEMLKDIGFTTDRTPYWGELQGIKNFQPTAANLAVAKPTDFLSGNAWEQLKKLSVPTFHELFTETTEDGLPRLNFRPIPFAIDKRRYRTIGEFVDLYKDLDVLNVDAIDVINFDLGEDNHSRYNSFLVTLSTSLIAQSDNISLLDGSRFPLNIQDSIKRYGFRPMHVEVNSIVKNAERTNGEGNPKILREFNELLYDYWNNAVFAESGTTNLIGLNGVKIGKCVTFGEGVPYATGKRYYVEGYTDNYTVGEQGDSIWTQTVMLTRGFEERDLTQGNQFGIRNEKFTNEGEFTPSGSSATGKNRK